MLCIYLITAQSKYTNTEHCISIIECHIYLFQMKKETRTKLLHIIATHNNTTKHKSSHLRSTGPSLRREIT